MDSQTAVFMTRASALDAVKTAREILLAQSVNGVVTTSSV